MPVVSPAKTDGKYHRIIVFARAPYLGQVKTRLNSALPLDHVLRLHERLVRHAIANVSKASAARVELWVDKNPSHAFFRELQAQHHDLIVQQQTSGNLGTRMSHALAASSNELQASVVIGSDCPAIDAAYVEASIKALNGRDVVIGPASDGGYVLLATRRQSLPLFNAVDWGSERVLQQTLALAAQANLRVRLLDELSDIDRPCDLGEAERFGLLNDQVV